MKSQKGFTLIELLIVLSVIAILVAIIIPSFRGMQQEGWLTKAEQELNTLQAAVESYYRHNDHRQNVYSCRNDYHRHPCSGDIHGIAVAALGVKMACAALGFTLAAWQLFAHPSAVSSRQAWLVLCGLGALALSSAAVLRWFS